MQSAHSHENEVAGYVDFRQDIAAWLTIDAGLRYDHHSTAGGEWVPQAGIVVRPIETGALKASVSKGFRNPNTREMYMYGTANHDSLRAERLWNYELSWRHRLADGFTYGANIFYLKGDNMIQTMQVDGKPRNVNTGEIENWGIEVEMSYPLGSHAHVRVNSSYLDMKNIIVAAPTYTDYAGLDYRCGKWFITAGLQYVDELYTAVGANETKESFWLLDASLTYALTRNVSLWARGENLLAQKYEINLGYPMPRATFMGGVTVSLGR